MEIEYRTDMHGIDPGMIEGMFVGWPVPPGPERLVQVMAGSHRRVWALAGDRVVGYIAAVGDGVLNAFIPWLEVHPHWQGRGIGTELVRRVLAQLSDMYAIDLLCDAELLPWYESLGFSRTSGAAMRNRDALVAQPGRSGAPGPIDAVMRPLHLDDAEAVLDAFTASNDMARQGDATDLPSARRYVHWLLDADHRAFVVQLGGALGGLVAMTIDRANRSAWMFWWTHPDHRGRGVASVGAATIADWALTAAGLQRLEIGYRTNNPASASVARRAGFIIEGLERGKFLIDGERVDAVLAARLTTDPHPGTPSLPRTGAWSPVLG